MESLVVWFTETLGAYISRELVIFIISMIPILELRGGLIAGSLLKVPITVAAPICVIGNVIPVPFILLFIRQIFKWLRNVPVIGPIIQKLEKRAMGKSDSIRKYEFWGPVAFVGIPLPGTGAWTGALIASLLGVDIKKSSAAILVGIALATIIMYVFSYLIVGNVVS